MKPEPLVSIITPLFNAEQYIEENISSIQQQTYTNWEHIIVDDASTDNSVALVEKMAEQDKRIKLFKSSKNKGAAYCRNLATEKAIGNYIAFLDADDFWHPKKLSHQIEFMQKENCLVSYTNYLHVDHDGNSLGKRIVALPFLSYKKQHLNNYVGNLTGIYNAEKLQKIYAPNIRKRQDWAVWLEAIKRSKKPALGLQEDLAYYRITQNSISANKLNLVKYNYSFYRDYLKYSMLKSIYFLMRFFIEYFFVRPRQFQKL